MQNAKTQAEIAQLKFDKAKVEQDLAAQVAANAKQDEIEKAQSAQLEADKAQMDRLSALIAKHARPPILGHADTSDCIFPDELDEIFR